MAAHNRQIYWVVAWLCTLVVMVTAQDPSLESPHRRPDPNNASIEGQIHLPSGQDAELNLKVTLRNSKSILATIFTNKHGEFRFGNLSEGTYTVEAFSNADRYQSAVETVQIVRSQVVHVTVTLRAKEQVINRQVGTQVVVASELEKPPPANARKEYEQAVKYLGKGDLAGGIDKLRRAIAIYPDYLIARNDLGVQYLKLNRLDEAAEQLRAAVDLNPKYFNARLNLGLVLIEQRVYPEAVVQLNQALAIDSASPSAHLWLGVALFQTNDLPNAERELSKALILGGPNAVPAHYYLGRIYLKRGDSVAATQSFNSYLQGAPKGEFAEDTNRLLKRLSSGGDATPKPQHKGSISIHPEKQT